MNASPAAIFEAARPRLLRLAYRMLGERMGAEDVVQEAWLRWQDADHGAIREPDAWLTTAATRLALDALRRARARRETYVGPWLPEPILESEAMTAPDNPAANLELAGDLSIALLHVLERLSPEERAAFILREAFDYDYAAIAETLGKNETACRKLVSRAKAHVKEERPRFAVDRGAHSALIGAFASAVATNDAAALANLLTDDAIVYSDGGGRVLAAINPVHGRDRVTRLLLGLARKLPYAHRARIVAAEVNGEPGCLLYDAERLDTVVALSLREGRIARIFMVRNPEKLTRH